MFENMSIEPKEPFLKIFGTQSQIIDDFMRSISERGGIEDESYQKPTVTHEEESKTNNKGGDSQ